MHRKQGNGENANSTVLLHAYTNLRKVNLKMLLNGVFRINLVIGPRSVLGQYCCRRVVETALGPITRPIYKTPFGNIIQ